MGEDLRDIARKVYSKDGKPSWEDLKFGALQRIADAVETMTQDKGDLVKENFAFRKTNVALQDELKAARAQVSAAKRDFDHEKWLRALLQRRIRAYKGVITKLKKKINRSGLNAHLEAHLKLAKAGK